LGGENLDGRLIGADESDLPAGNDFYQRLELIAGERHKSGRKPQSTLSAESNASSSTRIG